MSHKVRCYAQTMPGVDEITWLEIRSRFPADRLVENLFAKDENGIAVFDHEGELQPLLTLRTADAVFVQALHVPKLSRGYRDLAQIKEMVGRGELFGQAANHFLRYRKFSHYPSYQVVSRVVGKHEYKRKDFETAVLKGMAARYPKWTPVAQGGEVELFANLLGSQLLLGFRLSDHTQRERYPKTAGSGILRPSLAGATVFLTHPQTEDRFLDPFCGSGHLLLERQAASRVATLLGSDTSPQQVDKAWRSLIPYRRKTLPRHITIGQWDARYLPLAAASIDKIATCLPNSQQLGSTAKAGRLFPAVFREWERVLRPKGTAVFFTTEYDLVKEILRRFEDIQLMTGYSVANGKTWGRLYILERLSA